MDKIEFAVLNPGAIPEAEKTMAFAARLTQRGHKLNTLLDFLELYEQPHSEKLTHTLTELPHPTIQKFGVINILVVGLSRRALAQITRHQNEVKFMSTSLQYSDYSGAAQFVVPYALLDKPELQNAYLQTCRRALATYETLITAGVDNDTAGYDMPQSLRGALLISATPYQWKHMIGQRVCARNTMETQYILLRCWEELVKLAPAFFANAGPFCLQKGGCKEGKMACRYPLCLSGSTPAEILNSRFRLLRKETK